jgi:signal-transduction protein with cAMP-binding, CBS, and nucleotidyltransferase domain
MTAQRIQDVMTRSPKVLDATATAAEAASVMASDDIGDVIVCKNGEVCGIVTDRDITVRVIAEGRDPASVTVGEICSQPLVTLGPNDPVDTAVRLMREKAIRRIPVCDGDTPVGIVSLGDLAQQQDPRSVLAEVSAAPANN